MGEDERSHRDLSSHCDGEGSSHPATTRGPSRPNQHSGGSCHGELKTSAAGQARIQHQENDHGERKQLPGFQNDTDETSSQGNAGHHRSPHDRGLETSRCRVDGQTDQPDQRTAFGSEGKRTGRKHKQS